MKNKNYIRTRYLTSKTESILLGILDGVVAIPFLVILVFVLQFFQIKSPIIFLVSAIVFFAVVLLLSRIRVFYNAKIFIEDHSMMINRYNKVKEIKWENIEIFSFSGNNYDGFMELYLEITELNGDYIRLVFNRSLVESPMRKYELIKKIMIEKNIVSIYHFNLDLDFSKAQITS